MSTIKPGFFMLWKYIISPRLPSVNAGLKIGILFLAAQYAMQEGSPISSPRRAIILDGDQTIP